MLGDLNLLASYIMQKIQITSLIGNTLRNNPHMALSALLFITGICFLNSKFSMISGALFGAGASLLGAWVTEINKRRTDTEDKKRRESDARKYLAPELKRTIDRALFIHQRAVANFSMASSEYTGHQFSELNDLQKDFIPYMPSLYPNSPQFQNLSGDDATTLVFYYDSLHALDKGVIDWWNREGQLPVNIFLCILTLVDEALTLAESCIKNFDLENLYPPKYESHPTLSSKVETSKKIQKMYERFISKDVKKNSLGKKHSLTSRLKGRAARLVVL
ncbi:hypothetical protein [Methylocucumis oryzae]|uniref:Uncharacterized protein n=1 Tax=Methylocucumis oryzae TaxID=1632867 RepID=A0A0F3IG20_9GAMM|nr:hypothetical protein [Methylocucumis oryzae]KJV05691.1 hypothetical protein VZ94_16215 [Methylocucumis oryzae]